MQVEAPTCVQNDGIHKSPIKLVIGDLNMQKYTVSRLVYKNVCWELYYISQPTLPVDILDLKIPLDTNLWLLHHLRIQELRQEI